MKNILLFFCFLPIFSVGQNSYTVSNVPGMTANFTTLQGAIDSVAAGSTIYIFPSLFEYGNVNVNKKLTIIGTGFQLDQNAEPFVAPNPTGVSLSSIYFMPGSSNSYLQGVQLNGNKPEGRFFRFLLDSVDNITINRCHAEIWQTFPGGNIVFETRNTSNCTVSQCYLMEINLEFTNHSGGEFYVELGTGSQNFQFKNNLFDNRGNGPGFTFNHNVNPANYGTLYFTNNTFQGDMATSTFCNYSFFNNFLINNNPSGSIGSSIGLSGPSGFNITNMPGLFPEGSNNLQGVNPDNIFQYSTFGYHSFEQKWQVLDTSFTKHAANDGGEIGAFGGSNPYVFSGIPALPEIYSLTVKPDTANRGKVLVHIKARATN